MAPKRKTKTSKPNPPPVKTVTRVIRMEVTVEAPETMARPEWQSLESAIQSKALEVATHRPHDKAITIADSFETIGLTVTSVGPIEVGGESPEYSEARRLPDRWYRDEVTHCADDLIADLIAMDADEREDALNDMLHEAIDSRHCIIATAEARMVLAVSSNYDAYEDIFGADTSSWEARAFCAMEQDVREELERRREEWHHDDMPDEDEDEHSDAGRGVIDYK